MDAVVNPPQPNEPSHELYEQVISVLLPVLYLSILRVSGRKMVFENIDLFLVFCRH